MNIQCYSLIHLQFLLASDSKLAKVSSEIASRFATITSKEISQIVKQVVPEIHEEGEKFGLEVLTGKALSV